MPGFPYHVYTDRDFTPFEGEEIVDNNCGRSGLGYKGSGFEALYRLTSAAGSRKWKSSATVRVSCASSNYPVKCCAKTEKQRALPAALFRVYATFLLMPALGRFLFITSLSRMAPNRCFVTRVFQRCIQPMREVLLVRAADAYWSFQVFAHLSDDCIAGMQ